jgi:hypothetical protein
MSGERSNTLKYVGIGCGIAALLGICGVSACVACAGAGLGGVMVAVEAPAEQAHGFLRDVRTGNAAGAYTRMNATYRSLHGEAEFTARLAAFPALTTATDATLSSRNVSGPTATMRGTLDGASGSLGTISVELVSEGELWSITAIDVNGQRF